MALIKKAQDDSWIEVELRSEGYDALLATLQKDEPFLHGFNNWIGIIAFMRESNSCKPQKNLVLRSILSAHRRDTDHRWRTILLAMFWPGLRSIHYQKRHWDTDKDELWQNMVWVFLQVVGKIDVAKRPERLAQKIINDTVHRLCDMYRRKWDIANREVPLENGNDENDDDEDANDGEIVTGAKDDINYDGIELRILQESETRRLRQYLESGLLNEKDFLLIVETRVCGKSVADYAREVGMSYDLARKRRLRAEANLRSNKRKA